MKKLILTAGLIAITGAVTAYGCFWFYKLKPYSMTQLENLTLDDTGLNFRVPLESVYYPALVQYERKGDAVVVTIFKQCAIGPFRGIWWTPAATETLWQVIPEYDSITKRISARTHSFGLKNPNFVLRTSDGDQPLQITDARK